MASIKIGEHHFPCSFTILEVRVEVVSCHVSGKVYGGPEAWSRPLNIVYLTRRAATARGSCLGDRWSETVMAAPSPRHAAARKR